MYLAIVTCMYKELDLTCQLKGNNLKELKEDADDEATRIARKHPGIEITISYYESQDSWKWLSTSSHMVLPKRS